MLPYIEEGWVICIDPTNVMLIAEKVNHLAESPLLLAEMSEKALHLFHNKYCMEVEGRKLLNIFKTELL